MSKQQETAWIDIKAGRQAYQHILEHGLKGDDISLLLGASGGPKWFVLQGFDNYLLTDLFAQREQPLQLLGTSAGAWRFASYGRQDAADASRQFSELYRATVYTEKPDVKEITDKAIELLETYVTDQAIEQLLSQTDFQHHWIVARAKGWAGSESPRRQAFGLTKAMAANAISRKNVGRYFDRVVFHHPQAKPVIGKNWQDLPTEHVALTAENFRAALLATGSIPMVLAGVTDILGAGPGTYRDGGITDYHFDIDLAEQTGLVLYPHFHRQVVPGWFDKQLKWRRTTGKHWPNTIFISPSEAFLQALPYQKIPDRNDFADMDVETRQRYWQQATEMGYRMADQLADWIATGDIAHKVKLWSS